MPTDKRPRWRTWAGVKAERAAADELAQLGQEIEWERAALEQYDNKLPLEAHMYWEREGARL